MNIKELIRGNITEEELLDYYNARVTLIRLPRHVNGFVFNYKLVSNIFINKNLSLERIKETLIHEIAHLELNHLNQVDKLLEFSIIKCEDDVDKYIEQILTEI